MIATLNREVRAALDTPAVRQRIAQQGMAVEVGTSAALAAQVAEDIARYRVLATQIRLDGQ